MNWFFNRSGPLSPFSAGPFENGKCHNELARLDTIIFLVGGKGEIPVSIRGHAYFVERRSLELRGVVEHHDQLLPLLELRRLAVDRDFTRQRVDRGLADSRSFERFIERLIGGLLS